MLLFQVSLFYSFIIVNNNFPCSCKFYVFHVFNFLFAAFVCSNLAPQCECRDVQMNCTGFGLSMVPDAEKEITSLCV